MGKLRYRSLDDTVRRIATTLTMIMKSNACVPENIFLPH